MIKFKSKLSKKFYRLNQYITADKVRVVDEQGKQIGIFPKTLAIEKARESKVDLVEIAPNAKPPVCKIIDFKKFRYLEAKKQRQEKKKSKKVAIKEVRLTPFIAENDFNFRLKRAEEFLKKGDKVKITVRFHGRQIGKKEFGYELIKKAVGQLSSFSKVEMEPKFVGNQLEMLISPTQRNKNVNTKTKNQKINS